VIQRLLHAPQTGEQVNSAIHYAGETLKDLTKIEVTLGRVGRNLLHPR